MGIWNEHKLEIGSPSSRFKMPEEIAEVREMMKAEIKAAIKEEIKAEIKAEIKEEIRAEQVAAVEAQLASLRLELHALSWAVTQPGQHAAGAVRRLDDDDDRAQQECSRSLEVLKGADGSFDIGPAEVLPVIAAPAEGGKKAKEEDGQEDEEEAEDEELELEGSMWHTPLLVFSPVVEAGASALCVLLLMLNVCIQAIFCYIVYYDLSQKNITPGEVERQNAACVSFACLQACL